MYLFLCFGIFFWLTGHCLLATVWFKNTREVTMFSPISFAFILAVSFAKDSVIQLSLSAAEGGKVSWRGEQMGNYLPNSTCCWVPRAWIPSCLFRIQTAPQTKVALVREESWCISHPEVAGHSGSCPAPKCACALCSCMCRRAAALLGLVLGQLFSPAEIVEYICSLICFWLLDRNLNLGPSD